MNRGPERVEVVPDQSDVGTALFASSDRKDIVLQL